jgi:hypothetical protein
MVNPMEVSFSLEEDMQILLYLVSRNAFSVENNPEFWNRAVEENGLCSHLFKRSPVELANRFLQMKNQLSLYNLPEPLIQAFEDGGVTDKDLMLIHHARIDFLKNFQTFQQPLPIDKLSQEVTKESNNVQPSLAVRFGFFYFGSN